MKFQTAMVKIILAYSDALASKADVLMRGKDPSLIYPDNSDTEDLKEQA